MDKIKELEKFLINLYAEDNSVKGIYISGSVSNNSYDEYSDIDIRIILEENDVNKYITEFESKVCNFNHRVLFYEPCSFSNAIIPHFDNFIKADIFFYGITEIVPSIWLKNIKIVKDTDGFLIDIKRKSQNLPFLIQSNIVKDESLKFIALSHECFRRLQRGEYLYANYLLNSMKLTLINFTDFLNGSENIGWYKAEKRFEHKLIQILNAHVTDKEQGMSVFMVINELFLELEKKLCDKLNKSPEIDNTSYLLTYYLQ